MNLSKDRFKFAFILTVLAFFSLFPNLNLYEFRGEESLRVIVAYEMSHGGNLLQPTFLGDLYFNKPPLFNWFIIFSSYIIPWSELTARIVTIFFLFLTAVLIYTFTYKLTQNRLRSIFASLIYVTFIDILFWYGYLAEIDVTLAFFIFLMFYLMFFGYRENKPLFLIFSGIVAGVSFLLKGFPAYVFFGLSYISFVLFYKEWKKIFSPYIWIAGFIALFIPFLWILNTADPQRYVQTLFFESIVRAEGSKDIGKFLSHLVSYPLLNIKQLLPASLFVLTGFFLYRKEKIFIPSEIKLLLFTAFINYLPYLVSAGSRGRYVLPLFPVMAVVFSYILFSFNREKMLKIFLYTAGFFIFVRFLFGFIGFPIMMEKKASRKKAAYDIAKTINIKEKIAFDCSPEKSVAVYLDFMRGEPLKKSTYTKDWKYLLTCEKTDKGVLLKEYNLKGNILRLYKRK
ncbi:MAG: dolichyl-phosphate-mannose--protein mannosyltransferase [Aquificae bacterium]|nr:dolichyl-phosphate-mannose--protein mannosyltransferase [Aquificota bacterium]